MATTYTIDYGYTRTSTTKNIAIPDENNGSNWAIKEAGKSGSNEVSTVYVNTTSARDRVATLKRWVRKISNIYANSKILSSFWSPVKTGVSDGHQLVTTLKVESSDAKEATVYLPLSGTMTLNIPDHPAVSADVVKQFACDLAATYTPYGSVTSNQLARELSGAIEWLDESN